MTTKIKLGLALAMVIAIACMGFHIKDLKAELWESESLRYQLVGYLHTMAKENSAMRSELAIAQSTLIKREERHAAVIAEAEGLRNALEELYLASEPCAIWADNPLPDAVYQQLRK